MDLVIRIKTSARSSDVMFSKLNHQQMMPFSRVTIVQRQSRYECVTKDEQSNQLNGLVTVGSMIYVRVKRENKN